MDHENQTLCTLHAFISNHCIPLHLPVNSSICVRNDTHYKHNSLTLLRSPSRDITGVLLLLYVETVHTTARRLLLLLLLLLLCASTPTPRIGMDTSTGPEVSALTTLRLAEYSPSEATGRRLLAQFTDRTVIVYQAYKPELGLFAAEHDYFGDGFNFRRTSWIKPNFTWMMYRCGWASKKDQEVMAV